MAGRAIAGRNLMRLFTRNRWPIVIPIYDVRQCPYCASLITGQHGQLAHQQWHEALEESISGPEPVPYPGGYIVGHGELPASVRGGEDNEE